MFENQFVAGWTYILMSQLLHRKAIEWEEITVIPKIHGRRSTLTYFHLKMHLEFTNTGKGSQAVQQKIKRKDK